MGFVPYTIYLLAANFYYCGVMKNDSFQNKEDEDKDYMQYETVAYAFTVLGTAYFVGIEIV